jgi:hypothetical protein
MLLFETVLVKGKIFENFAFYYAFIILTLFMEAKAESAQAAWRFIAKQDGKNISFF